ncbi:putative peptide modification system cyclase [Pseudoxanthomonas sp. GM95]|uniref:putative peptide modification system cyclase n=1 Tax=Pseudoxanthomonas sp. GM95 TaxID=1881043 RepID=UPI0008D5CEB1|nr:putative peptide modification system cyclase [Pseudoxanthomonas sp. GM95]SEL93520.1 putative peptide modification system cyclase [Pseudoxanthomonas sp. GM95]
MSDANPRQLEPPRLRALLLTDLSGYTALVERLGDEAAAEVLREHDRLVLGLQRRWNGQLIDRSDGLLLLFERPLDGLGFALDFTRGLQELSQARGIDLKARVGLHVGEVLTWRNEQDAVSVGAKPLEVEGLAKPVAARLMALALPGQILLSAVAESLTRRASRGLGKQLRWRSHGLWYFKGVAEAQEVFEVGEPDLMPSRRPQGNAKARRLLPFWRRPAWLAAAGVLVLLVVLTARLMTRPALAFAERDWVVVADLQNRTGDALLDDSLAQAFLIGLQQSRYVNVVSSLRVHEVVQRMKLDAASQIDRKLAGEIAVRQGAQVVLAPSVSEIGDRVQIAVDVVDPASGETLLTVSKDGVGIGSVLGTVGQVVAELRDGLGETLESINRDSKPLPQVTTASLEALKAYALGQKARALRQCGPALAYYQQAVEFDPTFALAHVGMAFCYEIMVDTPHAQAELDAAMQYLDHLPKREQLYVQVWKSRLDGDSHAATERLGVMVNLYPDDFEAVSQYVWLSLAQADYAAAEQVAQRSLTERNPERGDILYYLGRAQLALGKPEAALKSFQESERLRGSGAGSQSVLATAARGDDLRAVEELTKAAAGRKMTSSEAVAMIDLAVQRGCAQCAQDIIQERLVDYTQDPDSFMPRLYRFMALSVRESIGGQPNAADLLKYIDQTRREVTDGLSGDREDNVYLLLAAYYLLQRSHPQQATDALQAQIVGLSTHSRSMTVSALANLVKAKQKLIEQRPDEALALLDRWGNQPSLLQAEVVRRAAYLAAGRSDDALAVERKLAADLPLAYAEVAGSFALQPLNVADVMEMRREHPER